MCNILINFRWCGARILVQTLQPRQVMDVDDVELSLLQLGCTKRVKGQQTPEQTDNIFEKTGQN